MWPIGHCMQNAAAKLEAKEYANEDEKHELEEKLEQMDDTFTPEPDIIGWRDVLCIP